METKAPASSLCLFKETRIDFKSLQSSVVQIKLPSSSPFSARSRQQQRLLQTTPIYKDEDTFKKYCLATSSSIHFSRQPSYPRNIVWRVLQEQRVLELRSGDLSKSDRETKEAALMIQLFFPAPIKHGGVALADSEDQNILYVFVLTKGSELYTCSIQRSFFCHAGASEDVASWCKIYKPATFSMSKPHLLVSGGPLQLMVALADGRVLQLTREKKGDGSRWTESVYGDGQWGSSLLGLVRWQGSNTVRYDGATLEQNTPIAIAMSPDSKYIFAVCLNHTLRIWNPNKAASVFTEDLLWQHREPHDISKVILDPGNSNVLQLFRAISGIEGDLYYAVTFSPNDFGQFKFWGIRDPDRKEAGVRDLFPESTLKAPDPDPSPDSKAIWQVADFKIHSERDSEALEMWILMRSNRRYKLYRLRFNLQDLESQWQDGWCVSASEEIEQQPLPQISDFDPEDVTEKWLEHLHQSGRYPRTVLEAALSIYNGDRAAGPTDVKISLRERMSSAVGSRTSTGAKGLDFDRYRTSTYHEWTILHQDVQDLNKLRYEVLSLAHDNATGMPWIVFADINSAVRSCSRAEIISQNTSGDLGRSTHLLETPSVETEDGEEPRLPDELAILIEAAAKFRGGFNHHLQFVFKTALASELWLDPSYSIPLRIQAFYDQCNFAAEIGAKQFTDLAKHLEAMGGFDNLDVATFKTIIDTLAHDIPSASSGMAYTSQGLKLLVNGAGEMISLHQRVLTDLLALVIVVEMEIDREEFPMDGFDGPRTYTALLDLLKTFQVMQWLVTNTRMDTISCRGQSPQSKAPKSKAGDENNTTSTIMESIFARDLKPQSTNTQSQSEALTQNIQDLLQWVVGGNTEITFDEVPVYIQCDLLRNGDLDLATDFFRFQPSTAWSTYIKGRCYLMKDKPAEAAIYFKKAAFKLSRPSEFDFSGASAGLLSPIEAAHFGHGLPSYYTHLINLFTTARHPTEVAQFAHLALQLAPYKPSDSHDQLTTTNLLESLFYGSLSTTDIPAAYSSMIRHPSPNSSLLPIFIKSLLTKPTALPQLLSLSFPPSFHTPIDALLAQQNKPKILAAWRMRHNDFRGAAAALLPDLQQSQKQLQHRGKRSAEQELDEGYLTVINLLACAGSDEGWVLSGGSASGVAGDGIGGVGKPEGAKRKVITLQDLRANYQKELDRRSVIESGRYDFGGGGEVMDVS